MDTELNRVKQLLVNNGYSNTEIDEEINKQLGKQKQPKTTEAQQGTTHILYYKNHMNTQYKTDEKIRKDILKRNIRGNNDADRVQLRI